jgi:hypothetical protein
MMLPTVETRAFEDAKFGVASRSAEVAGTGTSRMPREPASRAFEDAEIGHRVATADGLRVRHFDDALDARGSRVTGRCYSNSAPQCGHREPDRGRPAPTGRRGSPPAGPSGSPLVLATRARASTSQRFLVAQHVRHRGLLLADNPIDGYLIGDRTPSLCYGDNGFVTIYLQVDQPNDKDTANWLPAPTGDLRPILRMYEPGPSVLDGPYPCRRSGGSTDSRTPSPLGV